MKTIKKNGKTKLQQQKYQCKDCGKYWTDTLQTRGRPTIGNKPMSDAERARKYRQRKKSHL